MAMIPLGLVFIHKWLRAGSGFSGSVLSLIFLFTQPALSQQLTPLYLLERPDSLGYLIGVDIAIQGTDTFYIASWTPQDSIGVDLSFDGNRNILRVPTAGENLGTSTIVEWLEWWYFVGPDMSLTPGNQVVEVGTTNNIAYSISVSNPGGATLSNGQFRLISPIDSLISSFGSATAHAPPVVPFNPIQVPTGRFNQHNYTFRAQQDWVFGAESDTETSPNRTLTAVYPVLYGMSTARYDTIPGGTLGTSVYTDLSKLVQVEGDKTVELTGSGFIYYLIPKTWGDFNLSQILDHNLFDVTASFTAFDVTVSSTGLVNDWTDEDYKMYKLNTTTITSGFDYQFIR